MRQLLTPMKHKVQNLLGRPLDVSIAQEMRELLTTIKGMTQGRERQQLETVMAKGMQTLVGAEIVRIYKLEEVAGKTHLWLAVEVSHDSTVSHDDGISIPADFLELSDFPLVAASMNTGLEQTNKLQTTLPVITNTSRCFGVVEIKGALLSVEQLALAKALLDIFTNFLTILDYSETDTLTGLLNRKTFDEYLSRILTTLYAGDADRKALPDVPVRRGMPTADQSHWLAVIDIDHFKLVNDNFGHSIGDEVLLMVAMMMKESFRGHDKLFRFGGEEFVVLLKPTSSAGALQTLERFRKAIESRSFPLVNRLTLSIGFSQIQFTDQASLVLDRADQALYWVKSFGRNQVASYETLVESGALPEKKDADPDIEFF